jgi:hypothetical protein
MNPAIEGAGDLRRVRQLEMSFQVGERQDKPLGARPEAGDGLGGSTHCVSGQRVARVTLCFGCGAPRVDTARFARPSPNS